MQTKMVDVSLLSHAEIDWLNSYHAEVWEKVSPHKTYMRLASQIVSTHGFTSYLQHQLFKPVDVSLGRSHLC